MKDKLAAGSARTRLNLLLSLFILAVSLAAHAQPTGRIYKIGYLASGWKAGTAYTSPREAFLKELNKLGWMEGKNVVIEYRFAEGQLDRLPVFAEELVRLGVDIIVAAPTPAAVSARNVTRTIPIVGISLTEPVDIGLVDSLAHPGGNVTGVAYGFGTDIFGKQLELLREVNPKVRRVAVLSNPGTSPSQPLMMRNVKDAARSLGLQLQLLEARSPDEFDRAFTAMAREEAGALLLTGDTMFFQHRARLAGLAERNRLPSMSTQGQWAEAGGLLSYGPNFDDLYARAAVYVDKILKGAKPGELPIEQPTKFELIVNLKAARSQKITIPPSLLQRADRVLQ